MQRRTAEEPEAQDIRPVPRCAIDCVKFWAIVRLLNEPVPAACRPKLAVALLALPRCDSPALTTVRGPDVRAPKVRELLSRL